MQASAYGIHIIQKFPGDLGKPSAVEELVRQWELAAPLHADGDCGQLCPDPGINKQASLPSDHQPFFAVIASLMGYCSCVILCVHAQACRRRFHVIYYWYLRPLTKMYSKISQHTISEIAAYFWDETTL